MVKAVGDGDDGGRRMVNSRCTHPPQVLHAHQVEVLHHVPPPPLLTQLALLAVDIVEETLETTVE